MISAMRFAIVLSNGRSLQAMPLTRRWPRRLRQREALDVRYFNIFMRQPEGFDVRVDISLIGAHFSVERY